MSLTAKDRRSVPRVALSCQGELAVGTSVSDVSIRDMSMTGCGVAFGGMPGGLVGRLGVLSVQWQDQTRLKALLPVLICNDRLQDGRVRLGLKFYPLNDAQARKVIELMHKYGRASAAVELSLTEG